MIGTAFGCCIALQNVGMFLSPLIAGQTLKTEKEDGYYWTLWYFAALALICTLINVWVYIDDKKNRGSALERVDIPKNKLDDLLTNQLGNSTLRD